MFAAKHYLGQFYDGEAKARSEVAWVWLGTNLYINQIDNTPVKTISLSPIQMEGLRAVEVLPSKHVISVSYSKEGVNLLGPTIERSMENSEVQFDAKGGETYFIDHVAKLKWRGPSLSGQGMHKEGTWHATIAPYNPQAVDAENLQREILERAVSVDGIVQSWEHRHLVLTIPGSVQARVIYCGFKTEAGQKIRVFYFLSEPGRAVEINLIP